MTFFNLIKEHDIENLASYSPNNLVEVCFVIEANLALGLINKAQDILTKFGSKLKDKHIYDIFIHSIRYDSGKYTNENLVKSLSKDINYTFDVKVYALYQFIIGFYFLREGNYDLSKKYYSSSIKNFDEQNLTSWSWRSQFNFFLADAYLNDFSDFDEKYQKLNSSYEVLPKKAQMYFARFIIWLHLFRGNYDVALDLCRSKLDGFNSEILNGYFEYMNYIYRSILPETGSNKSRFSQAIIDVLGFENDLRAFKILIDPFNLSDRYMLAHIYIHKIYNDKKYSDLINTYDSLIQIVDPHKSIILPPCNLIDYPLLSSIHLSDKLKQENYMFKIRKECPEWIYLSSKKKVKSLELEANQNIIFFDSEKLIIKFKNHIIDIKKMGKTEKLLLVLFEGRKVFDINHLAELIYQKNKQENANENIKALCHRLKKLIGIPFYSIKGNKLIISDKYTFIKILPKGRKKQFHPEMIINLFKKSINLTLTTSQIKECFSVSKRTIIENLNLLIIQKRIKRLGHGNKIRYALISS